MTTKKSVTTKAAKPTATKATKPIVKKIMPVKTVLVSTLVPGRAIIQPPKPVTYDVTPEERQGKILNLQHDEKIQYAFCLIQPGNTMHDFVGDLIDLTCKNFAGYVKDVPTFENEALFMEYLMSEVSNAVSDYFDMKKAEAKKIFAK